MADKNGWSAAMKVSGGKSMLRPKHGKKRTDSKKHKTARGAVRGTRGRMQSRG
jgi:hypothetical protein